MTNGKIRNDRQGRRLNHSESRMLTVPGMCEVVTLGCLGVGVKVGIVEGSADFAF